MQFWVKQSCSQTLKGFHSFPFLSGKHGTSLPLCQFLNLFSISLFSKSNQSQQTFTRLLFYQFLLCKCPVIQAKQVWHLEMSSFRALVIEISALPLPWAYIPLAFVMVSIGFFFSLLNEILCGGRGPVKAACQSNPMAFSNWSFSPKIALPEVQTHDHCPLWWCSKGTKLSMLTGLDWKPDCAMYWLCNFRKIFYLSELSFPHL